jgi:hypothetical protein
MYSMANPNVAPVGLVVTAFVYRIVFTMFMAHRPLSTAKNCALL